MCEPVDPWVMVPLLCSSTMTTDMEWVVEVYTVDAVVDTNIDEYRVETESFATCQDGLLDGR